MNYLYKFISIIFWAHTGLASLKAAHTETTTTRKHIAITKPKRTSAYLNYFGPQLCKIRTFDLRKQLQPLFPCRSYAANCKFYV